MKTIDAKPEETSMRNNDKNEMLRSPPKIAKKSGISGSLGNDTLNGGAGDDLLLGDVMAEGVFTNWQIDHSLLASGQPWFEMQNAGGADLSSGSNDVLYGGAGSDILLGAGGNDDLNGGSGVDALWGGAGNDIGLGGSGNDYLSGDAQDDGSSGGLAGIYHGADWLDGGVGDDSLVGACSPRMQACSQGSRLLRSTQKIGQKFELTVSISLEHQGAANQGLWRDAG